MIKKYIPDRFEAPREQLCTPNRTANYLYYSFFLFYFFMSACQTFPSATGYGTSSRSQLRQAVSQFFGHFYTLHACIVRPVASHWFKNCPRRELWRVTLIAYAGIFRGNIVVDVDEDIIFYNTSPQPSCMQKLPPPLFSSILILVSPAIISHIFTFVLSLVLDRTINERYATNLSRKMITAPFDYNSISNKQKKKKFKEYKNPGKSFGLKFIPRQ